MTGVNHNHGNDTGNGNQSDSGETEDDLERPGLLYGPGLHYLRVLDVDEGVRVDAIPRENGGDRSQITIPHSLLPDDYPWRGRR